MVMTSSATPASALRGRCVGPTGHPFASWSWTTSPTSPSSSRWLSGSRAGRSWSPTPAARQSPPRAHSPGRGRPRHDAPGLRRPRGAAARSGLTPPDIPVLFLTARDAVEDRVTGLTAGGDDYVTKPFSLEEVVARLRALLRRTGAGAERIGVHARRRRPDARRGQPRGDPRRRGDQPYRDRVRAAALPDAQPEAGCCPRRRSSTGSGTTTSAARRTSWSSTSPTCGRRSMPAGRR